MRCSGSCFTDFKSLFGSHHKSHTSAYISSIQCPYCCAYKAPFDGADGQPFLHPFK